MMGSGKSTAGRILAEQLEVPFIDLDARVQRIFGRTIEELFAEGEERFRRCERLALESLVAEPAFAARGAIVATGGGVVIDPRNRETMLAAGVVVHLDVPVAELAARLLAGSERRTRPLLLETGGDGLPTRLAELLAMRRAAYLDRSIVVDARGSAEVVAARILAALSGSSRPFGAEGPDGAVEAGTQAS
jgi:shikimate kinase